MGIYAGIFLCNSYHTSSTCCVIKCQLSIQEPSNCIRDGQWWQGRSLLSCARASSEAAINRDARSQLGFFCVDWVFSSCAHGRAIRVWVLRRDCVYNWCARRCVRDSPAPAHIPSAVTARRRGWSAYLMIADTTHTRSQMTLTSKIFHKNSVRMCII